MEKQEYSPVVEEVMWCVVCELIASNVRLPGVDCKRTTLNQLK